MEREERTEQPTPAKREEARLAGRAARSRDLTAALSLGAGLAVLAWQAPDLVREASDEMRRVWGGLGNAGATLPQAGVEGLLVRAVGLVLRAVLPAAAAAALVAAASGALQGGFLLRWGALAPDLSRLSPLAGIRRMFGASALVRGGFTLFKFLGIAVASWWVAGTILGPDFLGAFGGGSIRWTAGPPESIPRWSLGAGALVKLVAQVSTPLIALGIAHWAIERWMHERSLLMTRAEREEEMMRLEGNPQLKGRRRGFGRGLIVPVESGNAGARTGEGKPR